ncbi:hypothetical protein L3Q82_019079, partial [Scortum barcoo]
AMQVNGDLSKADEETWHQDLCQFPVQRGGHRAGCGGRRSGTAAIKSSAARMNSAVVHLPGPGGQALYDTEPTFICGEELNLRFHVRVDDYDYCDICNLIGDEVLSVAGRRDTP